MLNKCIYVGEKNEKKTCEITLTKLSFMVNHSFSTNSVEVKRLTIQNVYSYNIKNKFFIKFRKFDFFFFKGNAP